MIARLGRFGLLGCAVLVLGCGGFRPLPLDQTDVLDRAESQQVGEIGVTVAVPSIEEARALFDSKLHKKGIQPVWIRVENRSDGPAWFFAHSVDADYFPPLEVSWRHHRTWAGHTNRRMDEYFYMHSISPFVPPGGEASGFVFVGLDRGKKYVPIRIAREGDYDELEFFVDVPGFKADYASVDFEGLYAEDLRLELGDEEALRNWIEELPCCATNAKSSREGDPLNFVLVGPTPAFVAGFLRSGWDQTAKLTGGTATKTGFSAVVGKSYRNAPISSLYLFDRPQDIGLQKGRRSVHQRNHLRLWLSPAAYRGEPVWVGQISRDIGSRLTSKSSTFTTHKIDPDVDDARDVLLLDLIEAGVLERFGYAAGVGAAFTDEPRGNLTGDPYFTDGLRLVLFLTERETQFPEIQWVEWEEPPPVRR